MCGIVGAVAQRNIEKILLEGLKRLEYRGYDSSGIVVLNHKQKIERLRRVGKVHELVAALKLNPLIGSTGLSHTRWATHGAATENNAHPHLSDQKIALVHNGIIENYQSFKPMLLEEGFHFNSETDTEVVGHLISFYYRSEQNLLKAFQKAIAQLRGAFAIGAIHQDHPQCLVAVRQGPPLLVGVGIDEYFIASDQLALLPVTQKFVFLQEGDFVEINESGFQIYQQNGQAVTRAIEQASATTSSIDKGNYRHYMQKEIFEQPQAIANTLSGRISDKGVLQNAFGSEAETIFSRTKAVQIVACGTSYHAGLIAKYWLEELAGIPCAVEVASEFRYRHHPHRQDVLFVCISQSGETADTMAALRMIQKQKTLGYIASLAICNVPGSSLVRESEIALMTHAGPEIGVASTKAFTTQLTALLMMVLCIAKHNGLTKELEWDIVSSLKSLPAILTEVLALDAVIKQLAKFFADKHHALFLGRGVQYPVAMEGALKLKEISYIHAEAYPAGELKHGPLALVDDAMPVITVAPNNSLLDKLKSNMQEVHARGGRLILFTDKGANLEQMDNIQLISLPAVNRFVQPIVYTLPLQLLSYHVALIKGTDIDQPRNLAKSVTVE